jgi:uncharacterized RDD family membrane protein YckC
MKHLHSLLFLVVGLLLLPGRALAQPAATATPTNPTPDAVVTALAEPGLGDARTNDPGTVTGSVDQATATFSRAIRKRHREIVRVGGDVVVKAGEVCRELVVIGGNVTIDGEVEQDVVVVSGSLTVNGKVGGDLVCVLGSAKLGPEAEIKRDAVFVGGGLTADPKAKIGGERIEVAVGKLPSLGWLFDWITKGLIWGRPLPHQLGWVWVVAGVFLLINLLLAVLLPRPVQACVDGMEKQPIGSLFTGFAVVILCGPLLVLLAMSGVGIILIPFVLAGLVVTFLLGKVAIYRYVGYQIGRQLGVGFVQLPLVSLIVGTAILYLFYTVPIIGFLTWGVISVVGVGAVFLTAAGLWRRERNGTPAPAAAPVFIPVPAAGASVPVGGEAPTVPPVEVSSYQLAGFWIRLFATALDLILLGVVTAVTRLPPLFPVLLLVYHVGMWTWRGTTIGGIVMGIRIVRMDGRSLDFAVALVRSLASVFSALVLFVGFFWAGWSRDKRAWHDLIAGTTIVKAPKGMALV